MKEELTYNYSKLKGRMREKGITQADLGKAVGIGNSTLNLKLGGKSAFRQGEISSICEALEIAPEEITQYFFSR